MVYVNMGVVFLLRVMSMVRHDLILLTSSVGDSWETQIPATKMLTGKRRIQSIAAPFPAPLWPIIIMEKNTQVDKSWKISLRQLADTVCLIALTVPTKAVLKACFFPNDGLHTRVSGLCLRPEHLPSSQYSHNTVSVPCELNTQNIWSV